MNVDTGMKLRLLTKIQILKPNSWIAHGHEANMYYSWKLSRESLTRTGTESTHAFCCCQWCIGVARKQDGCEYAEKKKSIW